SVLHAVIEDSVIADAVKVRREDVGHEPVEEFVGLESPLLSFAGVFSIDVGDGDGGFVNVEDAGVTDSNAMGVARQIADGVFGIDVGWLGVDNPVLVGQSFQECIKVPLIL
ncbi:MAG: hypothetical protein QGI24_10545, partial [Kiritimatiellia bacterium]|nr:hypothetical protein [Kiritimatiellia bacterium]